MEIKQKYHYQIEYALPSVSVDGTSSCDEWAEDGEFFYRLESAEAVAREKYKHNYRVVLVDEETTKSTVIMEG